MALEAGAGSEAPLWAKNSPEVRRPRENLLNLWMNPSRDFELVDRSADEVMSRFYSRHPGSTGHVSNLKQTGNSPERILRFSL